MIRVVFGSSKSGTALIPVLNINLFQIGISTYSGQVKINNGTYIDPVKQYDFSGNTANIAVAFSNFTGNVNVTFNKGVKDAYSLALVGQYDTNFNRWNILNFGDFIKQFTKLHSIYLNIFGNPSNIATLKGDLADIPISLAIMTIENVVSSDVYFNISTIPIGSKLETFWAINNPIKVNGDISNLPLTLKFFKTNGFSTGSSITYTAGKVWASSFDTLYLSIALGVFENDDLLNDLKNSVTTAIGGKVIYLSNGYRTSASDFAVSYLTGLGFTISGVSVIVPLKILDLPLQNNFTDYSTNGITMLAGNANGFPSFIADGSGYALDFGGTKSIYTGINLPINTSDKVSIEFDIKTSTMAVQMVAELSQNANLSNSFAVSINDLLPNRIEVGDYNQGINIGNSAVNINDGNFHNVKMVIDRALGINQNKIYVDGILSYVQNTDYQSDNNGNFGSFPLFIGQRAGNSLGFVGQMKNLKIYNYPIL